MLAGKLWMCFLLILVIGWCSCAKMCFEMAFSLETATFDIVYFILATDREDLDFYSHLFGILAPPKLRIESNGRGKTMITNVSVQWLNGSVPHQPIPDATAKIQHVSA